MSKARSKKRKKVRKGRKGSGPKVLKKVRLPREEVMHIHRLANGGDPAAARRVLLAFHSSLSARELDELVQRITDPQGLGGIETGYEPGIGDYADIAITA